MLVLTLIFFGLAVGSFLNLVIDRTPRDESILSPGSHCDACDRRLGIRDLVPVVSFIASRGRCRYCGHELGWRQPMVELGTAGLFVSAGVLPSSGPPLFITLVYVALLVGIGLTDLVYGLIPDVLVFPGMVVAGVWAVYLGALERFLVAAVLVLFFGALHFFSRGRAMGLGDVKLVGFTGMMFAPLSSLFALNVSLIIGSAVSLFLIAINKKRFGDSVPLGTFLTIGSLILLYIEDAVYAAIF